MNQAWLLAVIGLVVAALVLRPLIRGRRNDSAPRPTRDSSGAAGVARPGAADELAELDLDRSMGRISEADYARWRGEVESNPTTEQEPDAVVTPSDAVARAEALVRQWRDSPRLQCPACGDRPEPEAKYCSNCGVKL